jgi:thermolabile hemolysin
VKNHGNQGERLQSGRRLFPIKEAPYFPCVARPVTSHALIDWTIINAEQHGFDNVTDSCLKLDNGNVANYRLTHARRSHCTPVSFVFRDTLHPTTRTHRAMAEDVRKFIPESWLQRP